MSKYTLTIEELYKWAVKNQIQNYNIEVQYRDDGGDYYGTEAISIDYIRIRSDEKKVIL